MEGFHIQGHHCKVYHIIQMKKKIKDSKDQNSILFYSILFYSILSQKYNKILQIQIQITLFNLALYIYKKKNSIGCKSINEVKVERV